MAKSLLASRPKIGSRLEPRERWNLLDRDVLSWYASSPDREAFLRTVQEFRYIIEPEATAMAATRRTEAQMAEISQACREMGVATTLGERTQADTRFHLAILRLRQRSARPPRRPDPIGVNHLFVYVTREIGHLGHAQALHENIEKNIRLKRPAAARAAVRRPLANTTRSSAAEVLAAEPGLLASLLAIRGWTCFSRAQTFPKTGRHHADHRRGGHDDIRAAVRAVLDLPRSF